MFDNEHTTRIVRKSRALVAADRVDPRVVRTKERLNEALFELIQQRRWDKIRVQDILDRTGISRSAFYSHYDGKHALLTAGIPEMTLSITGPDGDELDFVPLFVHLNDGAKIMRPLLNQPVLGEIAADIHRRLVAVWGDYLADTEFAGDWMLPEYLAGALTSVVRSYVGKNERDDPEVVADSFLRHTQSILDHSLPTA